MNFSSECLYHIYNRGNNKQRIFFTNNNYQFFLNKIHQYLMPWCDILAYCLMPNHFHLLIYVPANSEGLRSIPNQNQQVMVRKLGTLLSSYSQAINKQERKTGSLFQQKTKSRQLTDEYYSKICFHYIHQNPLKAELVTRMEDWRYSSFKDYLAGESDFVNMVRARELLDIPALGDRFYSTSYDMINNDLIKEFE